MQQRPPGTELTHKKCGTLETKETGKENSFAGGPRRRMTTHMANRRLIAMVASYVATGDQIHRTWSILGTLSIRTIGADLMIFSAPL